MISLDNSAVIDYLYVIWPIDADDLGGDLGAERK